MKSTIRITSPQPNHETDITVKPYHYVKPLRMKRLQPTVLSRAKLVDCEIRASYGRVADVPLCRLVSPYRRPKGTATARNFGNCVPPDRP